MNDLLKELAKDCFVRDEHTEFGWQECHKYIFEPYELEQLETLIRADERDKCAQNYLQDCANAVEAAGLEEREQCAKHFDLNDTALFWGSQVARAIRQRGEK